MKERNKDWKPKKRLNEEKEQRKKKKKNKKGNTKKKKIKRIGMSLIVKMRNTCSWFQTPFFLQSDKNPTFVSKLVVIIVWKHLLFIHRILFLPSFLQSWIFSIKWFQLKRTSIFFSPMRMSKPVIPGLAPLSFHFSLSRLVCKRKITARSG